MSATTPDIALPRHRALPGTPTLRAVLASRLLVLVAGIAGALLVPRRNDWSAFDPAHMTERLGSVGNVLAGAAVRWDSIHYLSIAAHGYASRADAVFFPLYPLLIRAFGYVVGSPVVAAVAISAASLAVALTLLHRLTCLELGNEAADVAVLLMAFAPLSFFLTAVYTESLFLALSLGSVYCARRGRWRLACVLGGLAAVTRITGVLLIIPLAIIRRRLDRGTAWVLLVPAALAAYLGFLAARGFGALAPVRGQTNLQHQHQLTGPLDTVVQATRAAVAGARSLATFPPYAPSLAGPFSGGFESILLLGVLAIALAALVVVFRRLPFGYGAYAAAALLVCIASPVAGQPLHSLDRYTLTIFPLWMAAASWFAGRRLVRPVVLVGAGLLAFFAFQFGTWAFIA